MKSRSEARNEKDMYQKMLGHAQKIEESKRSKAGGRSDPAQDEPNKVNNETPVNK